jgi:hypothetical protein
MLIDDCTVDFEQPRALWTKVFDDTAKEHYIKNVAGHLGNVKSSEIKNRQRMLHLLDDLCPISHEMSRSRCLRRCRSRAFRPHCQCYWCTIRPASPS